MGGGRGGVKLGALNGTAITAYSMLISIRTSVGMDVILIAEIYHAGHARLVKVTQMLNETYTLITERTSNNSTQYTIYVSSRYSIRLAKHRRHA